MKVCLKEYARIHNIKACTVRKYVSRGMLEVIDRDYRYTYVDSEAQVRVKNPYWLEYGKQPRLSNIYRQIKARCYNPKNPAYRNYGGRGIKVCDEWLSDTTNFIAWALSNGYRDDLTIDRIDINGNYSPENCQWITRSENSKKRAADNKKKKFPCDIACDI